MREMDEKARLACRLYKGPEDLIMLRFDDIARSINSLERQIAELNVRLTRLESREDGAQ